MTGEMKKLLAKKAYWNKEIGRHIQQATTMTVWYSIAKTGLACTLFQIELLRARKNK